MTVGAGVTRNPCYRARVSLPRTDSGGFQAAQRDKCSRQGATPDTEDGPTKATQSIS